MLWMSSKTGDFAGVRYAVEHGADPNHDFAIALQNSINEGFDDISRFIISHLDISKSGHHGLTVAMNVDNEAIFDELLARGADPMGNDSNALFGAIIMRKPSYARKMMGLSDVTKVRERILSSCQRYQEDPTLHLSFLESMIQEHELCKKHLGNVEPKRKASQI